MPWARGVPPTGLRLRLFAAHGGVLAAVAIESLTGGCVVGRAMSCDVPVLVDGVANEHLGVGCTARGEVCVTALQAAAQYKKDEAATPHELAPGETVAVRSGGLVRVGDGGLVLAVAWGAEAEDDAEIVHTSETWGNTVANSVVPDEKELQRLERNKGWQKTRRWTGELSAGRRLTFSPTLVEYEDDAAAASASASTRGTESVSPPPVARAAARPPPPSASAAAAAAAASAAGASAEVLAAADGCYGDVPAGFAPKRLRRNVFVVHHAIPPPQPSAAAPGSAGALMAFPPLIVSAAGGR